MIRFTHLVLLLSAVFVLGCSPQELEPKAGLPTLTKQGADVVLTLGETQLRVAPMFGGRISSLTHKGEEVLYTVNPNKSTIWGSVLWTSPQIEWNWPPIEVLDSKPYELLVEGNQATLTSKVDSVTGYQIVKTYTLDSHKQCFSFHYQIKNHSKQSKTVAAWEVTRLKPTGKIFFPSGNAEATSGLFYPLPIQKVDDVMVVDYPKERRVGNHMKLMTDGAEGWMAYVNGKTLFVKEFADVPVELITPNEGELELYASAEGNFWEADQQGVATSLAPGESLSWQVNWYLFDLSKETFEISNTKLLAEFVRTKLRAAQAH